jgi:peptidoglycan/xylan/chitin deacetylase (PgdA/CDA1 family)
MATILVGYDVETAAVGEALSLFTESPNFPLYALALDPKTCGEALELLADVHADVGVPATLFLCGRTLLHALEPVRAAHATGLFDAQQHTFTHVPFKDIVYSAGPGLVGTIRASPPEALLEELTFTSRLLRDHLGVECVGVRTPFGYYRGLRERPDLLEPIRAAGLRYVTSWGRNEQNGNPTPWVQPFTYASEGYPEILELPFQFWLDVVWFDQHGYDTGPALLEALKAAVDEIVARNLVYGACFHDWVAIASDERKLGWLRGFLRYAVEQGVEVTTYTEYWRQAAGAGNVSAPD